MSGRHWVGNTYEGGVRGGAAAADYTLMTGGASLGSFLMPLAATSNTLLVGPDNAVFGGGVSPASVRSFNLDNGVFRGLAGDAGLGSASRHSLILQERDAANVITLSQTNTGTNVGYVIQTFNPSSTVPATNISIGSAVGSSFGNTVTVVEETANEFFVFTTVTSTAANSSPHALFTLAKTANTMTLRGTRSTPNANTGTPVWASKAIQTVGTNRVFYVVEPTPSISGNLFNFGVYTYDAAALATPPVMSAFTPSGAGNMPGASSINNQLHAYRTWAFRSGADIYVCVAPFVNTTSTTISLAHYYIHVYKANVATPTALSYVSSTFLGTTNRPRAIFPVDADFQNLIVPTNSSTTFLSWNLGTESYVVSSEAGYVSAGIAVDQTGRIWIAEPNDNLFNANTALHILSPTVSSTITVNFQNASLTYAGTVINTNLLVSAYNFQGSRVANNITLQMDSNSATFADDTVTRSVTTLANGDLLVPIKITGAGYVRVLANLAI